MPGLARRVISAAPFFLARRIRATIKLPSADPIQHLPYQRISTT
jgi:hypothetical protein